jgi:small subunit ribosomal protein S3
MSAIKHFIDESIRGEEIDAFLEKELERVGYAGAEIARTPLGTRIIIYAMKPGLVIGRRGENIRELTRIIEERFKLSNPQIAVSEIEVPELNARIMASRIADALQKGTHFRRTGFWVLNQIMKAGALGSEIIIRGKLTSQRHRYEKYRAGYIPRSGEPALRNTRAAVTHVKLKQGLLGINVKIIPPDATFPDRITYKPPIKKEALETKMSVTSTEQGRGDGEKNTDIEV